MDEVLRKRIEALPHTDDRTEPDILKARQQYPRAYIVWSHDEDDILRTLQKTTMPLSEIAELLKRSVNAIEGHLKQLGLESNVLPTKVEKVKDKTSATTINKATKPQHQGPIHQLLQYWRNSLADADKMGLSPSKMKEGVKFDSRQFKHGQLPADKIKRFFDSAEKMIKNKAKKGSGHNKDEYTIKQLSVIIAPYLLVKKSEHGKVTSTINSMQYVFPLWVVASLTREGTLTCAEEMTHPWIDRRCLTPCEMYEGKAIYPILGDVSQVDDFYNKHAHEVSDSKQPWQILFNFADELLQSVIGEQQLAELSYELVHEGYILPCDDIMEPARIIMASYEYYLSVKTNELPKLLRHFCLLTDKPKASDLEKRQLFLASTKHLGQMLSHYPLSTSQRQSLGYFNDKTDNSLFTVHGPPGTGKTSLLLSVIASEWVTAAVLQLPPPILVAASTNNLAVTNILDQFKQIGVALHTDAKVVNIRWLPDFTDFGLYLAPSHKVDDAKEKGYPYRIRKNQECSLSNLYQGTYQLDATIYFLKQFNEKNHTNITDLKLCQSNIHQQLVEKKQLLIKTIEFVKDFYIFIEDIKNQYGSIAELDNAILRMQNEKTLLDNNVNEIKILHQQWLQYKTSELKFLRLFVFIPFVKAIILDHIKLFISKHDVQTDTYNVSIHTVDITIENNMKACAVKQEELMFKLSKLNVLKALYQQKIEEKATIEQILGFSIDVDNALDFSNPNNVLSKLDTTLRYEMFLLATHYWEAAWLLESGTLHILENNKEDRKKFWQIQAMLTPCFVTTLHSGPGFFQYRTPADTWVPLADFIDLLIIDEAGQVMPAIAGAMIASAKRALLVGDVMQIEPIFSLPEAIDFANAKKHGLCEDQKGYQRLKTRGVLCSGDAPTSHAYGNLVVVGQHKSKYHLEGQTLAGLLLREHRRCAKEIISYCNKLCYNNQLIPLTDEQPSIFPRMGYAHIKGHEEKMSGSRCNQPEAEVIAHWINKNKEKILDMCQTKHISDCIGILTPFAAQSQLIKTELQKHHLIIDKVGTVHSLQGAEKPIIIFSPVYTSAQQSTGFFFDKSPNLLNVAVSRAKMSFLVFGDMDIFDLKANGSQSSLSPSSLLAEFIFAREENEIVDVIQPHIESKMGPSRDDSIVPLITLERHRAALKGAFHKTMTQLNIVSPYLRMRAIVSDGIVELIELVKLKNIKAGIFIYTDPSLNQGHIEEFTRAKDMLERAGAMVVLVNQVHSKIVSLDNRIIIIGSFNWLSAVRRTESQYQREETSLVYKGEKAAELIEETLRPIRAKSKLPLHLLEGAYSKEPLDVISE